MVRGGKRAQGGPPKRWSTWRPTRTDKVRGQDNTTHVADADTRKVIFATGQWVTKAFVELPV